MWARVVEFMLACWLAVSPYVFGHPSDAVLLWVSDYASAVAIALFSLMSFKRSLRRMHLANLLVALWLLGLGFLGAEPPPPPAYQNAVVLGLLIGMFAIIPSRADEPPPKWGEHGDVARHATSRTPGALR